MGVACIIFYFTIHNCYQTYHHYTMVATYHCYYMNQRIATLWIFHCYIRVHPCYQEYYHYCYLLMQIATMRVFHCYVRFRLCYKEYHHCIAVATYHCCYLHQQISRDAVKHQHGSSMVSISMCVIRNSSYCCCSLCQSHQWQTLRKGVHEMLMLFYYSSEGNSPSCLQFWSSLTSKRHPEKSHAYLQHQPIDTNPDIQTHIFTFPSWGYRQAWNWLPRTGATRFTPGLLLAQLQI